MNKDFYINVADYMLKKPTRKYCRPIIHEDDEELKIITVDVGNG